MIFREKLASAKLQFKFSVQLFSFVRENELFEKIPFWISASA
jgi:hypothetical protein